MSQVTLLSLDITSSPELKGVSSLLETDANGQAHEFSKIFQRQVNAEENGKTHAEQAKSTKSDSASSKNNLDKDAVANSANAEGNSSLKTARDNNPPSAKAAEQSSDEGDNEHATESLTTEDALLAQEQLNKQGLVGTETLETLEINVNEQAATDANKKGEVKAEPQSDNPIDFLTMLSASEKLLTEKVDASAINDENAESKTANAARDASVEQVKKGSVKATELSELSQQIKQALNQSSNKTTSSNDELAKQITGEPQNVSDKPVAVEQTINDESQAKVKITNASGEGFKLNPDVIQTEQTLNEKQLADASKNQPETVSEFTNKKIELPSADKKRVAEATATANKAQDGSHIAVASAEQIIINDSAEELSAQEKLTAMVEAKTSSDNISNNKSSSDKNIPQTKVVNNTINSGEFTVAKHDGVIGNAEQITEHELHTTSSEENKAVISQVVATATNATKTQSQETTKVTNAELAKTSALENLNSDDKSSVKTEVRIAESEILFDKSEQTMLANTVKPAQQFGLYQETSTATRHVSNETSNAAQLDAITNKHIAENIQQVKHNQIQLAETINIHRKDFVDSVKDKVLVMINQKLQQVDIKLDPPELGNVQVRVNLQGDAATVNFVVQNPQAKEALEQQMGKLRDMLNESGVDVGEANVEQQQNQQQDEFTEQQQGGQSERLSQKNIADDAVVSATLVKGSAEGVDFYA